MLSGARGKDSCQRYHFYHSPPTQGLKVGPRVRGVPYLVSWPFSVHFRGGDTTAGADVTCERDEIRALEADVWALCPHHSSVWTWRLTQSDREGDQVGTPLGTWPGSSLQTPCPLPSLGSHLPLPSGLVLPASSSLTPSREGANSGPYDSGTGWGRMFWMPLCWRWCPLFLHPP